MPAVNSGRSVSDSPPRSSKEYISLETTSVGLAQRAGEDLGALEDGHLDAAEAVELAHALESLDHVGEGLGLGSENVLRAPDRAGCLDACHDARALSGRARQSAKWQRPYCACERGGADTPDEKPIAAHCASCCPARPRGRSRSSSCADEQLGPRRHPDRADRARCAGCRLPRHDHARHRCQRRGRAGSTALPRPFRCRVARPRWCCRCPSICPATTPRPARSNQLAGLRFMADGKPVAWDRDPVEVQAFHLTLPAGTRQLVASFVHTQSDRIGPGPHHDDARDASTCSGRR